MNCAMTVLYEPKEKEILNLCDYCNRVDHLFVLDNSKEDNEKAVRGALFAMDNNITYKHFDSNIGLCRALNYGMKKAKEIGFEWSLIMDADSSFITDIVETYIKFLNENSDRRDIAVLAPVHIFDRSRNHGYEGSHEIKWAMTSGCFYNVDIFEELGGFKEELFVDGLDMDYCYKTTRAGYKVIELGNAQIRHYPGETRTVNFAGRSILKYGYASPWRYYMQARAIIWLIFEYQHFSDIIRYLSKWGKVIILFGEKKEFILEMLRGSRDGIKLWRQSKVEK